MASAPSSNGVVIQRESRSASTWSCDEPPLVAHAPSLHEKESGLIVVEVDSHDLSAGAIIHTPSCPSQISAR
jgi:hypothetical protein